MKETIVKVYNLLKEKQEKDTLEETVGILKQTMKESYPQLDFYQALKQMHEENLKFYLESIKLKEIPETNAEEILAQKFNEVTDKETKNLIKTSAYIEDVLTKMRLDENEKVKKRMKDLIG